MASKRDDFGPYCEKCGAELTTGLMAVFCERRKECAFYPEEPHLQKFVEEMREGFLRDSQRERDTP